MQEKIILSTVSAWELGEKFETTRAQKNDALREAKIARQDGDLSENAPYHAAKEKFRTMGRIQRRLTGELSTVAEISLGDEKQIVLIAGARDHHFPKEGEIIPIPYNSPLGTVLINHL